MRDALPINKLARICKNPRKYASLAPKLVLQCFSRFFLHTSFRLESQMDINEVSRWHSPEFVDTYGGYFLPGDSVTRSVVDLEPWDSVRRDMLVLLLRDIFQRQIPGDIAEVGVYKGYTAKLLHCYAPDRTLHLYDTFEGFDQRDINREVATTGRIESTRSFSDTGVQAVLRYVAPQNGNVHVHPGFFPESVPLDEKNLRYCFVHLDSDLYAPTLSGLEVFYSRLEPGGIIVVHDYNAWPGARKAVADFFVGKPEIPIPMPDKSGSAVIVKR
jgi:O-methyltransferase